MRPTAVDPPALAEDVRVLDHVDLAERAPAQRRAVPAGGRDLREVADEQPRGSARTVAARVRADRRQVEAVLARSVERLVVARVEVPDDARAGVGRQHALEPLGRVVGAVGDDDHPRVDRVADADAAAVVDADPRRARGDVEQRVQDRPVGDRVGAVAHRLGLAVRRGDGAGSRGGRGR